MLGCTFHLSAVFQPLSASIMDWVLRIGLVAGLGVILLIFLDRSRRSPPSKKPGQDERDAFLGKGEGYDGGGDGDDD